MESVCFPVHTNWTTTQDSREFKFMIIVCCCCCCCCCQRRRILEFSLPVCFFVLVYNGVSPSIIASIPTLCYALPPHPHLMKMWTLYYITVLYCTITMQWFVLDLHGVCCVLLWLLCMEFALHSMFFSHSRYTTRFLIGFCFILVKCVN